MKARLSDITIGPTAFPSALLGTHELTFHDADGSHRSTVHLDEDGLAMLEARLDVYERWRRGLCLQCGAGRDAGVHSAFRSGVGVADHEFRRE